MSHQELSDLIKNVHIDLRLMSRILGAKEAWEKHCENEKTLKIYAHAMRKLATEYWERNNGQNTKLSGVYWVEEKCRWYFFENGKETAKEKERKLQFKFFSSSLNLETEKVSRIKLLDVGSCYNPFKRFPIFDVTAVDLAPASDDVLKCDFLKVVPDESFLTSNFYDVVVFSLLLEYLPEPKQRYICCEKAYKLLKNYGILIIITPDSKHATANSKIMKKWRLSLSSIGFIRINYEKLKHLHCMIFAKCRNPEVPRRWFSLNSTENPETLIAIPQDFNDYEIDNFKPDLRSDLDNKLVAENFLNLAADF